MNRTAQPRRTPLRAGVVALLTVFLATFIAPTVQAAESSKVTGGTLTWGVRESFRKYLTGPIANGSMTPSESATLDKDKIITFTSATGSIDDGKADFKYKGKVKFYGHDGELNFTLANPELKLDAKGNGTLSFDYATGNDKPKRVNLADVKSASLKTKDTSASIDKATTTLNADGVKVFSYKDRGFYDKDAPLDPVSTNVTVDKPAKGNHPAPPVPPKKPTPPKKPAPGKKPAPSTSGAPASALSWGMKQSFRNYIAGPIAYGRITVSNHASASNGIFRFPQRSTTAKPPSATGTTGYGGSVNFYGHDGVLNLTLTNPRVVVPASGTKGQLVLDYSVGGKPKGTVSFATLDFSRGKKSTKGSTVSYQNVPATLTTAGTKPFEWDGRAMYTAGTVLDPVSFTIGANAKLSGSGGPSVVTGSVSGASAGGSSSAGGSIGGSASAPKPQAGAGQLLWGVRSSFRTYILGPIANGSITVSGGASNAGSAWAFPQSGAKTSDGGAPYRGSLRFYGHDGILNLTFADPSVKISGNTGTLSMNINGSRKDMVTLDLGSAGKSEGNGTTTYTGAPAKLTSSGSGVFSYQGHAFYPTGAPMDPVTFTIGSPSNANGGGSSTGSSTTTSAQPNPALATSPDSPKAAKPRNACVATGNNLNWGFKESFRSYIDGSIANGEWTTAGGATYKTPTFTWPKGSGSFAKNGQEGTVTFPGSVHFTGHEGMLDTTIANPKIELTADNKAFLRMDAKSTLMEAALHGKTAWVTKKDVRFVELDRKKIKVSKDGSTSVVTGSAVGTKLTAEGSAAFPNYTNGTAFDPLSFRITTGAKCVAASAQDGGVAARPKVAGQKESSGHSGNSALPWIGGGALGALGAAAAVGTAWARSNSRKPSTDADAEIPEDVDA